MPARIKIAESPQELEDLFVARHKVFVEEEGYLAPRAHGRIVDQFDAFPTTTNIIALMENRVVGGIRMTTCSPSGIPSDQFYNFSPFFQDDPSCVAGVSQFFLRRNRRSNSYRIGLSLMGMCAYLANEMDLSHLVAAVNPVIEPLLRLVGMEPVAPSFYHAEEGVDVLPMIMDMKRLKGPLVSMVKRQKHFKGSETFDREYFLPGEEIDGCPHGFLNRFVVINGKVLVQQSPAYDGDQPASPLMTITPGQSLQEAQQASAIPGEIRFWAGAKTELARTKTTAFTRGTDQQWNGWPQAGFQPAMNHPSAVVH